MSDRSDSSLEDPPTKRNKKTSKGLCITIDRVGNEAAINDVVETFKELNCTVKCIKDHGPGGKKRTFVMEEMGKIAEHCRKRNKVYSYVVVFITEIRKEIKFPGTIRRVNNDFTSELEKNMEDFKTISRIIVNHIWLTGKTEVVEPGKSSRTEASRVGEEIKLNEIHIISKMEGPEANLRAKKSSFVRSFCRIFKEQVNRQSIMTLVTMILRDRELGDYFKENTNGNHRETQADPKEGSLSSRAPLKKEEKKDSDNEIFEEVFFNPGIENTKASFITATETDSPNEHSPSSSSNGAFKFPHDRFEDKQISKIDMAKLLSMKIESKEMKVPKFEFFEFKYEMNRSRRGFCVIINQSNERAGAFVDEQRMVKLFKDELFFQIKLIHNKTHAEIKKKVKTIVTDIVNDTREHQCVFVFLMAHGDQDQEGKHRFYDVRSEAECSTYIFDAFTDCVALNNRPKIFVVQTCFGGEAMKPDSKNGNGKPGNGKTKDDSMDYEMQTHVPYVPGISRYAVEGPSTEGNEGKTPTIDVSKLGPPHKKSDTLWLHSTLSGYRSYRHMVNGTPLIRNIDSVFRERAARDDINQLMTYVNGLVSHEIFNKEERQQPIAKDNTLRSNLYLNPGYIQTTDTRLPENTAREPIHGIGSVVWSANTGEDRLIMVASENNKGVFEFKILDLGKNASETKFEKLDGTNDLTHVSSGVMIAKNKHLVVADKDDGNRKVVFMFINDEKKWFLGEELDVEKPIALCAINNDGFGILSEQTKKNRALFEAYHRKHFDIDVGTKFSQDNIQSEVTLRLTYGDMSSRDQVVYNRTKILILCVSDCTVTRYDINGNKEFDAGKPAEFRNRPKRGEFFNPCSVFWSSIPDKNNCTQLVVACCNAIHIADIKQMEDGKWEVTFKDPKEVDKIDRLWYDDKDVLYLTDDFIDYASVRVNTNAFNKIETDVTKRINDGWLRQTIWKTDDEKLVIGGAQATDISVIDRHSLEVLFTINPMTHGTHGRITSGFCSAPKTHVIISGEDPDELDKKKDQKDGQTNGNGTGTNGNGRKYPTQWVVELNDDNKIKVIKRANHKKNGRHPVVMFPVDSKKYGVICKETGLTDHAIIELRDLEEHKLKRTLKVQHKDVHINDHACVDEMGNIYMSSFKNGVVNKFDRHGKKLASLDKIKREDATPDTEVYTRLNQPYTLFLASDGSLVVQCCNAMYKYEKSIEKWVHISGFVGPAWDMCCVGRKMYTIYKEEFIPWEIDAGSEELL